MTTIVTRAGKGSPLTNAEVDANFTNLNTAKLEASNNLSDLANAATARTNLGVAIGTNVQAWDADLDAIAALAGTSGFLKKTAANTWSLDTNTYLTGNQTITFTGDATGSGATSVALTLANSGVTAGTYTKVTVDTKGRVTTGASLASADVTTALGFTPYNSTNPSGYITAASPALTGTPTAPTAAVGTNTTQLATTAFVNAEIANDAPTKTGGGASGTWGINITGNAGYASTVGINYNNDSNSTYQMLWGSGNSVYGTGGIYCNPFTDYLYAASFYCSSWFRSSGQSGWYNESYAVGIYATEAGNVRTYNGANFIAAGSLTANSDERLKTNWRDLASDFLEQLAGVKHGIYDRIDTEFAKTQVGVSAQALRPVLEHAVLEDAEGILSVNYGSAALVSAIQLAKQLLHTRNRVAQLEAKLAKIAGEG